MAATQATFTLQQYKTSVIQIYSYENKCMHGTLENALYEDRKVFSSLTQLLLLIQELQDEAQCPQRSVEPRRFKPKMRTPEQAITLELDKPMATFKVEILFRQNASWQGKVTWVEKGLASPFRSALELVGLMDSVLS